MDWSLTGLRPEIRTLLEQFPVRKSGAQKQAFRHWLTRTLEQAGYVPETQTGGALIKSSNVVVGKPETAKVVFTAHYDTPAQLPLPNTLFPHNMLFTLLAQSPMILAMIVLAIGGELLVLFLTDNALAGILTVYGIVILLLVLMLAGKANPSNVNDNTSGVATLLEIALALPQEQRDQVAFVFFDNEEKMLLGSAQLKKRVGRAMDGILLLNFDCVSDGAHIRFFPNKGFKGNQGLLDALEHSFLPAGDRTVQVVRKGGYYPSDQVHFPLGMGVAAFRKSKFGLMVGRIHTGRDTVFQGENVALLRDGALRLAARLADPAG